MKNISRIILLVILPVLAGCPPKEQITGQVLSLSGPMPKAAVLGMFWIEEADKAKPAPILDGLNAGDRDNAYEKDVAERGLPVAYARAFTDEKGWFTLDNFHFSGETTKAVKALKQPKISRITVVVFQRGYLKGAITAFPKDGKEIPYATIILSKPANWKELADDSSFDSLKRGEFYNGYSKEFGATEQEKNWFLEYTHSNLWKAYTDSDIKGNKKWEDVCGHDYSDVIISSAGMQRNPAHEKCAELLKYMGWVRKNEEIWADHYYNGGAWVETAKGLVKEAIAGLGADNGEPKGYEREVLEGMDAAGERLKTAVSTGLLEDSRLRLEEAKLLYGKGDRPAAYRALGQAIYARMRTAPASVQITKIISAAQDALAGFYQLMNRPLTAQADAGGQKADQTKIASDTTPSGKEAGKSVDISIGTLKKEYRIEMEKDSKEQELGIIKFKSPAGMVIKSLPYSTWKERRHIIISPSNNYLLQIEDRAEPEMINTKGSADNKYIAKISRINATGEKAWEKEFKVDYSLDEETEGPMPYYLKISNDGRKIIFIKWIQKPDQRTWSEITVFDETGQVLTSVADIPPTISDSVADYEISDDGNLLKANVFLPSEDKNKYEEHFSILNIKTGQFKILNGQAANWSSSLKIDNDGKVQVSLVVKETNKEYRYYGKVLNFEELNDSVNTYYKPYGSFMEKTAQIMAGCDNVYINISPDGRLIAGGGGKYDPSIGYVTFSDKYIFIDVVNNRVKIAHGHRNGFPYIEYKFTNTAPNTPLMIIITKRNENDLSKEITKEILFDDVPDDLATLFQGGIQK